MCNLATKKIRVVLLACFVLVNAEAATEKGGYRVLVSFSQNVKSAEGRTLLEKMRNSLEDASGILYGAVGRQFTTVTFKIPESWNISQLNISIDGSSISRNTKADFLIDGINDVIFGKFPFAQQHGGCGVPGHQITIPTSFFSDANEFPKGTVLAREWLKYRYGVFDENGYEGDPLYPSYYVLPGDDPNEVKITECTDSPITYNFTDQTGDPCLEDNQPLKVRLDSKTCIIMPNAESLENVTSSLMYFQQRIFNMQHICGKDPGHRHNALSPNKHNAMCRSQSVWDVVKMSENFQTDAASEEFGDIEFIYAQEKEPKVVVAWENTAKINKTKGAIILNAVKRFIYELPKGSKFNGFPFSDTLSDEKDYTLKELNELGDKNAIMTNIKSDFVKVSDGRVGIALSKALEILASDPGNSEPEGTIIVIAKSSGDPDKSLLERLQKSKVCVMFLMMSEETVSDETKNYASTLPCGSSEDISVDDNQSMFNQLFASMETVLPATVDDKITETAKTGYLLEDSSFSLQVDDSVETVTFWVFTDKESENFVLKFNQIKEKLQKIKTSDVMALSFNPKQGGSIEFAYPHPTDPAFTQVRVTYKAGKYLNGLIFTHDTTKKSSPQQMPVILYAVIRFGAYPVQNAKVVATVDRPNQERVFLEMFDDGRGDPDITQNDGVYSRYFTQFSEMGEYTVTVTVAIEELTSYGVDRNAGYYPCCGSFLKTVSSKVPLSSKEFKTSFTAKSGRPDDGYKPSRILDLKIDKVNDGKIVLKWSAPGDEGDSGKVQSYEVKRYTSHEDAMNDQNGSILGYAITPVERGGTQTLEIRVSDFKESGRFYLTITAKNAQQTGDTSNILEIFIPNEDATATPGKETTGAGTDSPTAGGLDKKTALIIGLVVGLILLIILILLVVFFLVIKPKRKEEVRENPVYVAPKRDENNILNPINFISADTLLRHHNEKTRAKIENKEPPIFKEEDFEVRHSSPIHESGDNNNTQQPEGSNKTLNNEESLPPKSPKKTTYV